MTRPIRGGLAVMGLALFGWMAGPAVAAPITGANGNQYDIIFAPNNGAWSWTGAKADAESRGGHLATITSAQEKADIESHSDFASAFGKRTNFFEFGPWIGGFLTPHASTDTNNADAAGNPGAPRGATATWYWVNGEGSFSNDVRFGSAPVPPGAFNDWLLGEPNHFGPEYYLAYGDRGNDGFGNVYGWADLQNNGVVNGSPRVMAYVLEVEKSVSEPVTLLLLGAGLAGLGAVRRKRR